MSSERFSGYDNQAVRGHRSAWDRFDSEPDSAGFDGEEGFGRMPRSETPMTLVRFRDYGAAPAGAAPSLPSAVDREPSRRRGGAFRRAFLRTFLLTAVWLFGLAVGAAGIRFLPLEKWTEAPAAPNDGEYAVENLAAEPALSPAAEPRPAVTVPLTAAAAVSGPAKAAADDSEEWSVEVLDTIASIPPWDPKGNLSDDAPTAPDSYETAGVLPVEPIPAPRIPDVEKKTDTFTAARPQPFAAAAPSGPAPAETEPEEPSARSADRIAENDAKPMKNQIEYFEPFESVSFSSHSDPAIRVTASEEFYNDAYGVDNFSDYLPPRRDEEEIPSSEPVFRD